MWTARGGSIAPRLPFRKIDAIEPLSSVGFPSENRRYRSGGLSVANSDNKQGRFDSTRFYEVSFQMRKNSWCCRAVAFSEHEGSDRLLDGTKFLKGVASENVPLSEPLRLSDLKTAIR